MEEWLRKVMVEHTCPDCGGKRLKPQRFLVTVGDRTIHDLGEMSFQALIDFLRQVPLPEKKKEAGTQVVNEIIRRLRLLLDIGLNYLTLNRPSSTLSGGESQRIRLSTQIGSDLIGMLYILDEPTIGLHLADIEKLLDSLNRLVAAGHTVIVIEHHMDVIKTADWIIDLGPEGGDAGGRIVAQGAPEQVAQVEESYTGRYLRGVLSAIPCGV